MTRAAALTLAAIAALATREASAATRTYVVAIGNDERPVESANDDVSSLQYADDDAAAIVSFWRELGATTELLTVLDAASQRRFPSLAEVAQPPTLARLRAVVSTLGARFEADRRAGDEPSLVFFYSGHGSAGTGQEPSLAMLDGGLTRKILYDEILAVLPARYVHLIIDACHAEAIVRPRDAQAEVVPVDEADLAAYAARNTLRRFPQVGAVMATSAVAEAHEWDEYQRGVFTFQVLSALRGAADVNGDGAIEYSELSAFLGSANASVVDPRAKLAVIVRPPDLNRHAAIADLSGARGRAAILTGIGPEVGRFFVEDERGNRLGEIRAEAGYRYELLLPSGERLYMRAPTSEGSFEATPGTRVAVGSVVLAPRATRSRGAVESSLRRGLFATPFGPAYYRGFVDARADLPSVDLSRSAPLEAGPDLTPQPSTRAAARWSALALALVGAAGLAVGTAYGLEVMSKNDDIDSTCVTGTTCSSTDRARYDKDIADAKTARKLSIVGFAAGSAALVAGGALFWWARPRASDGGLSLGATVGPATLGATMGGTW
ncbi:MAG TPA: caspase family protein [Polyangia bacterium]|nr:caspase family protein [Polyangia bacterium]